MVGSPPSDAPKVYGLKTIPTVTVADGLPQRIEDRDFFVLSDAVIRHYRP